MAQRDGSLPQAGVDDAQVSLIEFLRSHDMRHHDEDNVVVLDGVVPGTEDVLENRDGAQSGDAGPVHRFLLVLNAAEDAGFALAEPDSLVDHALADDGFGDTADGYLAALRGDGDVDLEGDVVVVVDGGRHLDVHAHVCVLELGVDQRTDQRRGRACLIRAGGDGDLGADLHGGFLRVHSAHARALQNLGVVVGEQQIERGRSHGDSEICGVEMGKAVESGADSRGGGAGGACGGGGGAGTAGIGCRAVGLQGNAEAAGPLHSQRLLPVLAHFEHCDVDYDLAAGLVEVVDELLRQQELVGGATHDDGVLALHRKDLGSGHEVADCGGDVIEVVLLPCVGQIEGLHGLLIQVAPLGGSVLGHEDGIAGDRTPEGIGHHAYDAQGVEQRNVVQVHVNAAGVEVGIEHDIDAGGLAHGLIHHLGVLGHMQGERLIRDRLELRRRLDGLELLGFRGGLRKPHFGHRRAFTLLLAEAGNLLLRGFVAGVDFGGVEELAQRGLGIASLLQLAALTDVN